MKNLTKDEAGIILMGLAFYQDHLRRSLKDPEENHDWTRREIEMADELRIRIVDECRKANMVA